MIDFVIIYTLNMSKNRYTYVLRLVHKKLIDEINLQIESYHASSTWFAIYLSSTKETQVVKISDWPSSVWSRHSKYNSIVYFERDGNPVPITAQIKAYY